MLLCISRLLFDILAISCIDKHNSIKMTFDNSWMDRDLIGYGPDRPDPKWPNGAKIAVNCMLPVHFDKGPLNVKQLY